VRSAQESNAINRVLKARGLPSLDESGVLEALGFLVEDHTHFTELLKACEPALRRDMYEAMRPHLRFVAKDLESYIMAAKEHANAAELPVIDEHGILHPYRMGTVETTQPASVELWAQCAKCQAEATFAGANLADAIFTMRTSGWAYDESTQQRHLCPECMEAE